MSNNFNIDLFIATCCKNIYPSETVTKSLAKSVTLCSQISA